MNYKRIYDFLMVRAKDRILSVYSEKHHIKPRCLGGSNLKDNIVSLTAKEHYIAHRLLTRIYSEEPKLVYAFWMMCNGTVKKRPIPSPRAYEEAKLKFSKIIRTRKHSKATKLKISKSKKGQASFTGKTHTEESKIKQRISAKSRTISKSTELKRRNQISETLLNKPKSEKHRLNISLSKQGPNNPMYGKKWKLENGKRVYYI